MRKMVLKLLLFCVVFLFIVSCTPEKNEKTQSASPESQITGEGMNPPETDADAEDNPNRSGTAKIDLDLSALSSTMVYAEVYNIMVEPDSYVGKTIRGSGEYDCFYYKEMDRYFHYFIISDATGCCPQGLDFIWNGEHIYPDDYPEIGEVIKVTGVFKKDEMEGLPYYYIAVDDLTILK